jgi:DNA-binding response OmpR family regulator
VQSHARLGDYSRALADVRPGRGVDQERVAQEDVAGLAGRELHRAALAGRQPAARARRLRVAGIELDPLQRTVSRDGRQLDLSVKEFGVLEALMLAAPAFLRAEDLLEQVWDEHADPFTNTVTVTIGRLRRKLGDPAVITTTPGVGYRIGEPAR